MPKRKEYNIEKHGNKYRLFKMIRGRRLIISFDHEPTQSEIELAIAEAIQAKGIRKSSNTFEDCAKDYLEANDGSLSPNTLKEYEGNLRRLPDWYKRLPLSQIDELNTQKVISEYAKGTTLSGKPRSRKTINNMWHFISVVLRKNGIPSMTINVSGASPEEDYMPTEQDIKKLLKVVKDTELEVPVKISAFCSLRESELLALTMEDVSDSMIHVDKALYYDTKEKEWKIKPYPKNASSVRYTPVPKKLYDLIHKKGYIYPYRPNVLRRNFHKACEKAGIPHMRFHRLRAYYSSALHSASVPDKYIMARGGWKTDTVLKKNYQRALADKQSDMDAKMINYFNKF